MSVGAKLARLSVWAGGEDEDRYTFQSTFYVHHLVLATKYIDV